MNKNILLAIIGVVVVGLVAVLVLTRDGNDTLVVDDNQEMFMDEPGEMVPEFEEVPADEPAAQTSFTVTYTNNGFSPSNINVPVGATVTFVNQSNRNMWVASNPHPTHTGLPGFDSRAGLAANQTYQFTFNSAGSWGYHDHLMPNHTGTVVVE